MRHGLFSDVHGNLEAFEAVLDAIKKENVDSYIFLGDIVGYGANPRECIRLLKDLMKESNCFCIAGNHDYAVCGLSETKDFNPYAKEAIDWTKRQVDKSDIKFLSQFELVQRIGYLGDSSDQTKRNKVILGDKKPQRGASLTHGDFTPLEIPKTPEQKAESLTGFTIVHATLTAPGEWGYIFDIDDAYPNFKILQTQVCFIGHSHRPVFFTAGEIVDWFLAQKVTLKNDSKYIINIGSVGQPRDGNPKASYAIYDSDADTVEIRRLSYDVKKAQDKIMAAGLPEILAERLSVGR